MRKLLLGLFAWLWISGAAGSVRAGVAYPEPEGGWNYVFEGDQAVGATPGSGYASLDGTWSHDNGSDQWDRTEPGGEIGESNRPGGVVALSADGTDFIRIQDTGDPRDHDGGTFIYGDPGSNRRIYFIHDMGTNAVPALLDNGVALSFRARVPTTPPLDPLHPDGQTATSSYPEGGDGYLNSEAGKGNFVLTQAFGGSIAFSMVISNDLPSGAPQFSGLMMNALNGTELGESVDYGQGSATNFVALDSTQWHEYWIVVRRDEGAVGSHEVFVFADGALTPSVFKVTAGTASDLAVATYIGMGMPSTEQSGALDVDFLAYKIGPVFPDGAMLPDDGGDETTRELDDVSISQEGDEVRLVFSTESGKRYQVEFIEAVTEAEWMLQETIESAPGGTVTVRVSADENVHRFYRVLEVSGGGSGVAGEPVELSERGVRDGAIVFTFEAAAGGDYRVEFKESLEDNEWTELKTVTNASAGTQEVTDLIADHPHRFYRVVTL